MDQERNLLSSMTARKKQEELLKRGRRTKYNPDIHPMFARLLADKGLTEKQMAKEMKVTDSTFRKWKKEQPEFSAAIEEGKMGVDDLVEAALLRKALGWNDEEAVKIFQHMGKEVKVPYTRKVDPDYNAQRMWLHNRRRKQWSDKTDIDLTVNEEILDKLDKIRKKNK